jgi:hypothetical protein
VIVGPEQASNSRSPWHRNFIAIEQAFVDQESEYLLPTRRVHRGPVEGESIVVVVDEPHLWCEPPPAKSPPPSPNQTTEANNGVRISVRVGGHHGRSIARSGFHTGWPSMQDADLLIEFLVTRD